MTSNLPAMDLLSAARRFALWSLLVWLSLGMVLEALHGFKVGWYLDVANEARRLMFTLAHTHGTLLAVIQLAIVAAFRSDEVAAARLGRVCTCLRWAGLLMPVGFLLAGVQIFGADPGFAIVLVPVGGLFLFVGVLSAAQVATTARVEPPPASPKGKDAPPKRN